MLMQLPSLAHAITVTGVQSKYRESQTQLYRQVFKPGANNEFAAARQTCRRPSQCMT